MDNSECLAACGRQSVVCEPVDCRLCHRMESLNRASESCISLPVLYLIMVSHYCRQKACVESERLQQLHSSGQLCPETSGRFCHEGAFV